MNTKVWNMALLSRSIWLFHTDVDSLWVRWVKANYLRDMSIWDYETRDRDSFLFKKLLLIRDKFLEILGGREGAIEGLERCCIGGKLKSGLVYDILRTPTAPQPRMLQIWKNFIPPRFSFVVWLACRRRLATRDTLHFLELDDTSCVFCGDADETRDHLFFSCSFTREVWRCIRGWLDIHRLMTTIESSLKWIKKDFRGAGTKPKMILLAFCSTVYEIWRARNARVFEDVTCTPDDIVARVKLATFRVMFRMFPSSRLIT